MEIGIFILSTVPPERKARETKQIEERFEDAKEVNRKLKKERQKENVNKRKIT